MANKSVPSLTQVIYTSLRDDIINQNISFGQKLNIRELSQKFGVSTTPVREAFARLQAEGLVEHINNAGVKVLGLEENDVREIMELAMLLECDASTLALSRESIYILAAELLKQQEMNNDAAFHNVFFKYCGNNRLVLLMDQINGQRQMLRSLVQDFIREERIHDHDKIIEAVQTGSLDNILEAIRFHYEKNVEVIIEGLKKLKIN